MDIYQNNASPDQMAQYQQQTNAQNEMINAQNQAAQYAQLQQAQAQAQQMSMPQMAMPQAASYYYNPSYPTAVPYSTIGGIPAASLYPQNGFYMGQGIIPQGNEFYAPADPNMMSQNGAYASQGAYLPVGASFYMPPGSGMPYMDPYGLMNPASIPSVPQQPKKQPKKKSRNCC